MAGQQLPQTAQPISAAGGLVTRPWFMFFSTLQTANAGPPVLVGELPSKPGVGSIRCVTDATSNAWGATVVGGGAFVALVWWNGTAWTVIGQ